MTANFKYSKCIFTHSRLKQAPWWLHVRWPSYSCFFHWSTQRGRTIDQSRYCFYPLACLMVHKQMLCSNNNFSDDNCDSNTHIFRWQVKYIQSMFVGTLPSRKKKTFKLLIWPPFFADFSESSPLQFAGWLSPGLKPRLLVAGLMPRLPKEVAVGRLTSFEAEMNLEWTFLHTISSTQEQQRDIQGESKRRNTNCL